MRRRDPRHQYPIAALARVLGVPRSSVYYHACPKDAPEITSELVRLAGQWPTYGYRRLTAELHRSGHAVNHKRVRGLMRRLGILRQIKPNARRTTMSRHHFPRYPNLVEKLVVHHPDQVWVADITYIRLHREFVYLAVIMDQFTRNIRGWQLGRNLDHTLTLGALRMALHKRSKGVPRKPTIHHSDQGVQYAASAYTALLKKRKVKISMAERGAAWQNGYAERLMRTIKEEHVRLTEYEDLEDARRQINAFISEVYTKKRIHSSLGYKTPAEFERVWKAGARRVNKTMRIGVLLS
jgi:transposase InsO family protein